MQKLLFLRSDLCRVNVINCCMLVIIKSLYMLYLFKIMPHNLAKKRPGINVKKRKTNINSRSVELFVAPQRFERRYEDSKSPVLPLNDSAKKRMEARNTSIGFNIFLQVQLQNVYEDSFQGIRKLLPKIGHGHMIFAMNGINQFF